LHCVYKVRRRDPVTGKVDDYGCIKHEVGVAGTAGHDHYNIYPEHDESSGDIIYQQRSGDPTCFRVGPQVIFENITGQHDDGLNYDFRDFDADIHPNYHREERNLPQMHQMSEDDIGEIMGESDPCLVCSNWGIERFMKIPEVEVCGDAIYGPYNEQADMTMPKCFKSYSRDIYGWVNYTNKSESVAPRKYYLSEMTKEQIVDFCNTTFSVKKVAERMSDALLYVKDGNYLDMWLIMKNNFVSRKERQNFLDQISTRSKKELYKGSLNLKNFCELYNYIDQMRHKYNYVDINGKEVREEKYLSKEYRTLYKQNVLNYILNYPELEQSIDCLEKHETNHRYWHVIMLLKRAKKDKILKLVPKWIVPLIKEEHDPQFRYLGENYNYSSAPKDIKDEYDIASLLRLDTPDRLYPSMMRIKDKLDTKGYEMGWFTFCDILNAGRKWNMAEIRLAWEYFKPAYAQNDPSIFWDWIEKVVNLPYETNISVDETEVIEYGACDYNIGDGYVSPARAFAMNLSNQMYSDDSWEVQKQPLNEAYDAKAKVRHMRECNHETFWTRLAHVGLSEDKLDKALSDETYEEIMEDHMQGVASMYNGEVGLSDSDLYHQEGYNPLTGDHTHLNGGLGTWQDEE
jgi:hypothetical protein